MSEEQYRRIFSRNLRHYMSINNKEQIDIINDLGFNKSAVSTWYNGTRLPRMDKVDALARYFGINRSDLIEEKNSSVNKSEDLTFSSFEKQIIIGYRQADDISKAMVLRALSIEEPAAETKETKLA